MLVRSRQHGFTMVELMIGLAILGILIMAALPSYQALIHNMKIRNAAESILNGLQLARGEAVRLNRNVEFVIGADSTWTVTALYPLPAANVLVQTRSSAQGSNTVTVTKTPDNTATTVTFNPLGRIAANADGSASLTSVLLDVPTTMLPAADSRDLLVTVTAGGNVRMCDPTVPATDARTCTP